MSNKNQEAVKSIAAKHLGKVGGEGYKATYDPDLLVAIPRYLNREAYSINEADLPFLGGDVWNAYEVSAITEKGLPVSGMLKIWIPVDSPAHVESKSIKLYLNSFNMTKLGKTAEECIRLIEQTVMEDLSQALTTRVSCRFFRNNYSSELSMEPGFNSLEALVNLDEVEFDVYHSDASQLTVASVEDKAVEIKIHSDLLRSNCRVTNQPDWGDVFIHMEGMSVPDYASIAKYIVSHRQVSHFHEEVCEMIFIHLMQAYTPEKLMVSCLYTRRGGIDINPIRATHQDMIPKFFSAMDIRLSKTLRQ
jgi:7-cyano-7-deazaguanine reductase